MKGTLFVCDKFYSAIVKAFIALFKLIIFCVYFWINSTAIMNMLYCANNIANMYS